MAHSLLRTFIVAFAATLSAAAVHDVDAQPWPNKPVRIVVPFAPGGATDIIGRLVAQKLSERMGQQFIIENRPGAGGIVAAKAAATSAPKVCSCPMLLASRSETTGRSSTPFAVTHRDAIYRSGQYQFITLQSAAKSG